MLGNRCYLVAPIASLVLYSICRRTVRIRGRECDGNVHALLQLACVPAGRATRTRTTRTVSKHSTKTSLRLAVAGIVLRDTFGVKRSKIKRGHLLPPLPRQRWFDNDCCLRNHEYARYSVACD